MKGKTAMETNNLFIPDGFIVFVSGVPGVGKTTISYELLRRFDKFRIIEETDLIRETLRGYNEFIKSEFGDLGNSIFNKIQITDHTKLLTFDEAKEQCTIMKHSFEQIIARQQRKGIPTILNGVHIIPEVLNGIAQNQNVIYINLYVTNKETIYNRIVNRNPSSYMLNDIPLIFQTNNDLFESTEKLIKNGNKLFNNIDVTFLKIDDTINAIKECIKGLTLK